MVQYQQHVSFVKQHTILRHPMSYYAKIHAFIISAALLFCAGCGTTETIIPSLTFYQYSSAPKLFRTVSIEKFDFGPAKNNREARLRNNVNAYLISRFQPNTQSSHALTITPTHLDVEKKYLQIGGKNDIFSTWKSFDQFAFISEVQIKMTCDITGKKVGDTVRVTKSTKVPSHYSPYKRDIYMMKFMEGYVADIDEALNKNISSMC